MASLTLPRGGEEPAARLRIGQRPAAPPPPPGPDPRSVFAFARISSRRACVRRRGVDSRSSSIFARSNSGVMLSCVRVLLMLVTPTHTPLMSIGAQVALCPCSLPHSSPPPSSRRLHSTRRVSSRFSRCSLRRGLFAFSMAKRWRLDSSPLRLLEAYNACAASDATSSRGASRGTSHTVPVTDGFSCDLRSGISLSPW